MTAWLSRNASPIAIVILAMAVVVGAFEAIDAFVVSTPTATEAGDAEMTGVASLAGLIKVAIFLGIGALVAVPLRRRFGRAPAGQN